MLVLGIVTPAIITAIFACLIIILKENVSQRWLATCAVTCDPMALSMSQYTDCDKPVPNFIGVSRIY